MERIQKLPANRITVLKALLAGGRIEKRRAYPFPETYHLRRVGVKSDSGAKVEAVVIADLVARRLIQPARAVNLSLPGDADNLDYIYGPGAERVVADKGVRFQDTQEQMFADVAETSHRTSIEPT